MSSFEERLAAARAAETAATSAASRAKDQADDEAAAGRSKAFQLKPAVEDAVAAVAALPLPAPYKATEFHRRRNRQDPLLEERIGLYSVYLIEDFQKPRIGKNGTVTPVGWDFSISYSMGASLRVQVYKDRPATFSVSTPALMAPRPIQQSLEQLCSFGVVRWGAGSYKDSTWQGGVVYVHAQLDRFLSVAAEFVAKCG